MRIFITIIALATTVSLAVAQNWIGGRSSGGGGPTPTGAGGHHSGGGGCTQGSLKYNQTCQVVFITGMFQ